MNFSLFKLCFSVTCSDRSLGLPCYLFHEMKWYKGWHHQPHWYGYTQHPKWPVENNNEVAIKFLVQKNNTENFSKEENKLYKYKLKKHIAYLNSRIVQGFNHLFELSRSMNRSSPRTSIATHRSKEIYCWVAPCIDLNVIYQTRAIVT